jgi:hypothetical protein
MIVLIISSWAMSISVIVLIGMICRNIDLLHKRVTYLETLTRLNPVVRMAPAFDSANERIFQDRDRQEERQQQKPF